MRNLIAGVVACVLCSTILFAQGPDTLWVRTYGGTGTDKGYSAQQTADNGYIIAGYTNSFGAGGYDVYLIKTDENGDTLWTRTFGGTGIDQAYSVQQTQDNGYIVAGRTYSFGAGSADVWLIKTDAYGNAQWTKTYGGTGVDIGSAVQQTADNGYIIAGYTKSFGAGNYDFYLIKTDANGDTLWTKTYGGAGADYGYSVQQTADYGYIVAGYTNSFGAGNSDYYLVKTDANGDMLWAKTYGGTDADYGYSVQQTADYGYIVAGYTMSFGAGMSDFYLVKTDANGDTLWTRTYGGAGGDLVEGFHSVQQVAGGGYVVAGHTTSFGAGVWLLRIDANGDTLWTRTYGTDYQEGYSVQQTADGGYIIAGWDYYDVYLIKTAAELPEFVVVPLSIDFGSVPLGSSRTDSVTVTNTGIALLDITSVESDNSEFTVTPSTAGLVPSQSMQFYITFAPTSLGAEMGNIVFTHNAQSSPDTVTVTGDGVVVGAEPEIQTVLDIPDDQGRWVRVTWSASLLDQPGSVMPITLYGVWRRLDNECDGLSGEKASEFFFAGFEDVLEGWDCMGTVPAIQDSVYNFVSPTLGDSNAYGIYYSVFMITAHTQDPYVWFASEPDSGYSIDNIPPETPYDLAAQIAGSDVILTWQVELSYPDFSHFAVYRDTIAGFTPGAANQIGTSEVAAYTDSALAVGTYYYVVSALDINGNESDYSNEVQVLITGVKEAGVGVPAVYALSQNYPNPFKTETGIRYQLPQPGVVTIAIYNVSGQRIKTLVEEKRDAGHYAVHWDGRSQDGKSVSNGVYFCRLEAGEYTAVKKILLMR
ncbi:choice-of-anchor D domain-containing protein [candidate division WOR-3 bacterium]|nr:choice-of-anchor D domain-containing protein [candidate division WOR-3 bacterium]